MKHFGIDLNRATYVGMDCHPGEHTAIAVNRFEEEKGRLAFANSWKAFQECLSWLQRIDAARAMSLLALREEVERDPGFFRLSFPFMSISMR